MEVLRFFETPDGGSAFENHALTFPTPFTDAYGNVYGLSRTFEIASAIFAELPNALDQHWHGAPNRQLVVVLTGRLEVETSDGETRRWGPGNMFMADDTGGQGHKTRVIEGPAKLLFLRLAAEFNLAELVG